MGADLFTRGFNLVYAVTILLLGQRYLDLEARYSLLEDTVSDLRADLESDKASRSLDESPFSCTEKWCTSADKHFIFPKGIVIGIKNQHCNYGDGILSVDAPTYQKGYNCPAGNGSVTFGFSNAASEDGTSVVGGKYNVASGKYSSIVGGSNNVAIGKISSAIGGSSNIALGKFSIVTGYNNVASGIKSMVVAGSENKARGNASTVIGGTGNILDQENITLIDGNLTNQMSLSNKLVELLIRMILDTDGGIRN